MKLIKIKTTDFGSVKVKFSFVIDGLNIKLEFSDEIFTRTTRVIKLKKALSFLENPEEIFLMNKPFVPFKNEEIIYEIEFNKLEELLEIIPEEFL